MGCRGGKLGRGLDWRGCGAGWFCSGVGVSTVCTGVGRMVENLVVSDQWTVVGECGLVRAVCDAFEACQVMDGLNMGGTR